MGRWPDMAGGEMGFSVSKAILYGAVMFVALAIGQSISGAWSLQGILITSAAGAIVSAILFGYLMREVTLDVAGATPQSVESAIRGAWALRSFKAGESLPGGSVRYARGAGILGDIFTMTPTATGVKLTGPASVLNVVRKKAAGR